VLNMTILADICFAVANQGARYDSQLLPELITPRHAFNRSYLTLRRSRRDNAEVSGSSPPRPTHSFQSLALGALTQICPRSVVGEGSSLMWRRTDAPRIGTTPRTLWSQFTTCEVTKLGRTESSTRAPTDRSRECC